MAGSRKVNDSVAIARGVAGRIASIATLNLYNHRELVRNLVTRDLKVRYRNSVLGFLWSLLNPLLMMAVFTVVFSVLLRSDVPRFPLFIMVALLPWNYAVSSVTSAVHSIVANSHLINQVYFPRIVLPTSLVLANLVNFVLALPILVGLLIVMGVSFTPLLLYFPLIMVIQTMFLLGLAYAVSAINVFFRDAGVIIDVLVLAWFFLTPIFYRMEQLSPEHSWALYWVNPMASIISSYRLIVYDQAPPDPLFMVRTVITASVFLIGGWLLFRRLEPAFGEEI